MVRDVLLAIETQADDSTNGFNALIESYNSTYDENVELLETIDIWDLNQTPSQMSLPALTVDWQESPYLEPVAQGKWRGEHVLLFWYWINAITTRQNRKHLAGMEYVIRKFVDQLIDDQDPVVEVEAMSAQTFGFRTGPEQLFACLRMRVPIIERFENP